MPVKDATGEARGADPSGLADPARVADPARLQSSVVEAEADGSAPPDTVSPTAAGSVVVAFSTSSTVETVTAIFGSVTLESLNKLTLRQLVDGAKRLGLTAVSKLKKEALVKAVMDAWHARDGADQTAAAVSPATNAAAATAPVPAPAGDPTLDPDTDPDPEQTPPLSHKFEVGEPGRLATEQARNLAASTLKEIPWGYGRNRVTAMPVDPNRLYAYWEVLDESIVTAREKLGRGGPGAWLNLRVYDTTGRIFDGTNAHSFFDHSIERGDRQWFFTIGRPTSELVIEIGMKSHEGYFVKIARSGRVEFPRNEPAPWAEPEWLRVRVATGETEHDGIARLPGRPYRPASVPPAGVAPSATRAASISTSTPSPAFTPAATVRRIPWADAIHFGGATAVVERHEWEEVHTHGKFDEYRSFRSWDGPTTITTWEAGPFAYPVEIPEPVRETFSGKTRVLRLGGRTHIIYGPWQVIIRGLGAQQARVVLSRWEVHRTWAEETGRAVEAFEARFTTTGGGASERMLGSSDRRWGWGSEVRLGGSSEIYFLKASELRLAGASERMYAAASEWRLRGASERLYAGASEYRMAGASELRVGGASELRWAGASELRLGGASERLSGLGFLGASEGRLGPAAGGAGGLVYSDAPALAGGFGAPSPAVTSPYPRLPSTGELDAMGRPRSPGGS